MKHAPLFCWLAAMAAIVPLVPAPAVAAGDGKVVRKIWMFQEIQNQVSLDLARQISNSIVEKGR